MAEYIIQKAVNIDKVLKKRRLTIEEYGKRFLAQHKYDGCYAVVDVDAGVVRSRTGEFVRSMPHVVEELRAQGYAGHVVMGEAWTEGYDFSVLSGMFRTHAPQPDLGFVVFDILTNEEWGAGETSVPYRIRWLKRPWVPNASGKVSLARTYPPGSYGHPQALCDDLVKRGGYDGLILRDPEGGWKVGSGTTGEIVKVKRKLSFDLRVTAVHVDVGAKTGRPVYSLSVDFRGRELRVGSGMPHNLSECPTVGNIVEVEAMDHSSDGLLREPRLKGIRYDKLEPDAG
jgi:ATP-dependent DNA ligase